MTSTEPIAPVGPIDYDNRRFSPPGPVAEGTQPAVGHYHHAGDLVWAEFSGPTVQVGRLVGKVGPDGTIDAAYGMVMTDGRAVAGTCVSTPTVRPDGRVLLTEHWRRMDGSSGVSLIEEVD